MNSVGVLYQKFSSVAKIKIPTLVYLRVVISFQVVRESAIAAPRFLMGKTCIAGNSTEAGHVLLGSGAPTSPKFLHAKSG